MIKKIKRNLYRQYQNIKWTTQIGFRHEDKASCKMHDIKGEKILYIVPHADDDLLGGNQLIRNNKNHCMLFYCGFLGTNETQENGNIREKEFIKFCKTIGVPYFCSKGNLKYNLMKIITEYKPQYIFLPSIIDWHEEHRLVNILLQDLNRDIIEKIKICWYQISVPIPIKFANYFVSVTRKNLREKKLDFKNIYKSQAHMLLERYLLEEKFCGKKTNCYAAERYVLLDYKTWNNLVEKALEKEKELNLLKNNINDLKKIYEQSNHFYYLLQN